MTKTFQALDCVSTKFQSTQSAQTHAICPSSSLRVLLSRLPEPNLFFNTREQNHTPGDLTLFLLILSSSPFAQQQLDLSYSKQCI